MKKMFALAVMAFAACTVFAQSAEKITEILDAEKLTYSQAAYLSQSATNDGITEEDAFTALVNSGVLRQGISASDQINAKTFALICAKTFNIKGSMFSKADKSGRYAFRQMKIDGVFNKNADPSKKLSGRDAMYIITNCLENYEIKEGAE